MTAHEQPTGHVVSVGIEEPDTAGDEGRLDRWLRPGGRRPLAAVLLVASATMIFLVTGYAAAGVRFGTPGGFVAVSQLMPVITSAVVMGGLAAFVLAGSPAARVLGGLAALGGLLQLVLPLIAYRIPLGELGWVVLVYGVAVVLHAATIVALMLPVGSRRRAASQLPQTPRP